MAIVTLGCMWDPVACALWSVGYFQMNPGSFGVALCSGGCVIGFYVGLGVAVVAGRAIFGHDV